MMVEGRAERTVAGLGGIGVERIVTEERVEILYIYKKILMTTGDDLNSGDG